MVYRLNNSVVTLVHESVVDKVEQTQYANATQIAFALEDNIHDLEEKLSLLATLPAVLDGDTTQCSETLKQVFSVIKLPIANLSRLGVDGIFNCSVIDTAVGINGFEYSYIASLFNDENHSPVFSRLLPLLDSEGKVGAVFALHVPVYREGVFAGSLGGAFWMSDILPPILSEVSLPPDSWVVVLDDNGDILWHPDPSLIGLNINGEVVTAALAKNQNLPELLRRAITEDSISDRYYLASGDEHIAYARRIQVSEDRHWSIIITTPSQYVDGLLADSSQRSSSIDMILLLLILASIPCIGWLMWYWERSLERAVVNTTQELADKNTELASAQSQLSSMVTELAKQKQEAERRADESDKLNKLMVDRELKMIEMKKQNTISHNEDLS